MGDEFDDPVNPGVDVVRRGARRFAEECGYDLDRMAGGLRAGQAEEAARGRKILSTPFPPHDLAA